MAADRRATEQHTLLVVSFLTITAAGLCNTYGDLHL